MDSIDRFFDLFEQYRRIFKLEYFHSENKTGISIRVYAAKGTKTEKMIVSRNIEWNIDWNDSYQEEFDLQRGIAFERACNDLSMWLGGKLKKYGF